jgi:hypothetical protein
LCPEAESAEGGVEHTIESKNTAEAARKLAGITKWEFQSLLGEEGMLRRYDVEDPKKDLSTVEKLRNRSEQLVVTALLVL